MQIDPGQPIMFDTESAPGRGTGYWQMDPGRAYDWGEHPSARSDTRAGRIVNRMVLVAVFVGIPLAALDMLLR